MEKLVVVLALLLSVPALAEEPASNSAPKKTSLKELLFGGHNVLSLNNLSLEIGGSYFHIDEPDWSMSRGTSVYRFYYRPLKFLFVYAGLQNDFTKLSLTFPGHFAPSPRFEAESSGTAIGTFGGRLILWYAPRFVIAAAGEYEFMKLDCATVTGVNVSSWPKDAEKTGGISYELTRAFASATVQFMFGRWQPYLAAGYYWTYLDAKIISKSSKLESNKISRTAHTPFIYPGLSIDITRNIAINFGGIVNPVKNPSYSAHFSFIFTP